MILIPEKENDIKNILKLYGYKEFELNIYVKNNIL